MPETTEYQSQLCVTAVTISSGQTDSEEFTVEGTEILGIEVPTGFEGTALSFKSSRTAAGTYRTMINSAGDNVAAVVAADRWFAVTPGDLRGAPFLKLVADQQSADRTLYVISKP